MKHGYIKNFWENFKKTLINLYELDNSVAQDILHFIGLSWPVRYPEKILLFFELVEYVYFSFILAIYKR
jgi:hypothetical protein